MLPKLLTYASLQSVLQFMDPNLRYQLSQRLPHIRTAELTARLRIESLNFIKTKVQLNDVYYQFGLIRKHDLNEEPASVKKSNESGGLDYDVDQYGCLDQVGEQVLSPGDLILSEKRRPMDNKRRQLESKIRIHNSTASSEDRKSILEECETELYFLNCQRDGVVPPYKFYIQLTITSPRGVQIERVEYNKKLWQARKELITKLLARGIPSVRVDTLHIHQPYIPLRWPLGLKLAIRRLLFIEMEKVEGMEDVLCETSFPLKQLWMVRYQIVANSEPARVINSSELFYVCSAGPLFPLRRFRNQKLHVNHSSSDSNQFMACVEDWFKSKKEAGYCWTFKSSYEQAFSELLDKLMTAGMGAIRVGDKAVHILTGSGSVIKVFYTEEKVDELRPRYHLTLKTTAQ